MFRVQVYILVKRIQNSLRVNSCMGISYFCTNECELIIMRFFGVCTYCLQLYYLYDTASEVTIYELKIRKIIIKQASKTIYIYIFIYLFIYLFIYVINT